MSVDNQVLAAAPVPFKVNGKEYLVYPLTDADVAELDAWVRGLVISTARESLPPNASQDQRDETMRAACIAAINVNWYSPDVKAFRISRTGAARYLWQSVKKNKGLTFETVLQWVRDNTIYNAWRDSFDMAENPTAPQTTMPQT